MENGRQGIKPRFPLEDPFRQNYKYIPQKDTIQRTHLDHQSEKFQQEAQNFGRNGGQDYKKSSYYLSYRETIETEREYSDSFSLTRSGQPTKPPTGFTPLRYKQRSDQESPIFPFPGSIQER
ncbi:hypothetical protein O181_026514 [Austropuccinia psidii MF-1]|uniref:Uncharacterized protein n=1 Tax=Austropuccinia psidii MF-1 TaxID=1389203 RepID=A0A9Q3CMF9_9BASI|nr:hypothetical protein [Austropuccinia psidii MF-1]